MTIDNHIITKKLKKYSLLLNPINLWLVKKSCRIKNLFNV